MTATSGSPTVTGAWTDAPTIPGAHLLGAGILALFGFMAVAIGGLAIPAAIYLDANGYITRAADHAVVAGLGAWIVPFVVIGVVHLAAALAIVTGARRGVSAGAVVALAGAAASAAVIVAIATGHDPFASVSTLPNHSSTDGLGIMAVAVAAYAVAFVALVARRPARD